MITTLPNSSELLFPILDSLKDFCLKCSGLGILCNQCPVHSGRNHLLDYLPVENKNTHSNLFSEYSRFDSINEEINFDNLLIEKNSLLLVQNSIENYCSDCPELGVFCNSCPVHDLRRNIASLPVNEPVKTPLLKSKSKKSSGGGCSTGGCSTGCSTK